MGLLVCEGKSVRVCSREGAKVESTYVRVVGLSVDKMVLPFTSIWIAAIDNIETTDGQETVWMRFWNMLFDMLRTAPTLPILPKIRREL